MTDSRPMKMVQRVSFLCCQFCSYKTRFTGNLAKHIRTHTGERPFECQFCGKRFASKSNYNTHVIIHAHGGTSSKISSGGRLRRTASHRQYSMDANSDFVRNVPVVKTLLSSSRSSSLSRSAMQQLSPIGSFLMPDRVNSSFSHTALYSSLNFPPFGPSLSDRNESLVEDEVSMSCVKDPLSRRNVEDGVVEDSEASPEEIEATNVENGTEDSIGNIDVKPSVFDILSALPQVERTFGRRLHEARMAIKEEAVSVEDSSIAYVENSHAVRSSLRRRKTSSDFSESNNAAFEAVVRNFNGNCPPRLGGNSRLSASPAKADDDPSQIHTQMLIDTLIKESRLFRCEACNILFPEYCMYVLHLGCHGNEGTYQCHFCKQYFDDRFGFTTHFVRCPHEAP